MKKIGVICLFAISVCLSAQAKKEMISDIQKLQTDLNAQYENSNETPLREDNFDYLKEHPFLPIDLKYRVNAIFVRTKNAIAFELPTSSGRTQPYIEFGKATFNLDGKTYTLSLIHI